MPKEWRGNSNKIRNERALDGMKQGPTDRVVRVSDYWPWFVVVLKSKISFFGLVLGKRFESLVLALAFGVLLLVLSLELKAWSLVLET